VQGKALGFGCAIAAACDVTLASDAAIFQVPEMGHNILPGMVMSSFIDRVTRKALSYLVWSTNEVSAERALSYGIVSDVFPAAKLDGAVDAFVAAVLKAPPIAVQGVKEFTKVAYDMPTPGAVDYARNLHSLLNTSSEMRRNH
jgi:enoyl-CoA hydratase